MRFSVVRLADDPRGAKARRVFDKVFLVGTARRCDVVVKHPEVAPMHARITVAGERIVVEDLGSALGTQLNGVRIIEPTDVRAGDVILVGSTVLRFFEADRLPAHPALEVELLARLREHPEDDATRAVYADWLEHHELRAHVNAVRLELARDTATDASRPGLAAQLRAVSPGTAPGWRLAISRTAIEKCPASMPEAAREAVLEFACPERWSALTPTADPGVRTCGTCAEEVFYCRDLDEVRARGAARQCVAFDASLTRDAALQAYERYPVMMGKVRPR